MALVYSPLCDSDPGVYREYMRTARDIGKSFWSPLCETSAEAYSEYVRLSREALVAAEGPGGGGSRGDLLGASRLREGDRRGDCDRRGRSRQIAGGVGGSGARLLCGSGGDLGSDGVESGIFTTDGARKDDIAGPVLSAGTERSVCDDSGRVFPLAQQDEVCLSTGGSVLGDLRGGEKLKVGKWRRKNERKKQKKLERDGEVVKGRVDNDVRVGGVDFVRSEARQTLEAKWVVENKLAKLKAEQELEIAMKRDLFKEAKKREVETMRRTESAKVAVEKSFATLRRTGNVVGHCETVVSGAQGSSGGSSTEGDCTISPDSSVSRAEVQEMQKQLLDFQKRAEDAEKLLRRREVMERTTYASSVAEFTAGSESVMSDGLKCELDRKFGERYEYDGKIDGKHVVRRIYHDGGMDDGSACDGSLDFY